MEEYDTLTYQVKRSPPITAKVTDNSLITQERTQKLDLLLHLLTNLTHSLVVCGPEGIGKTTLLRALQDRNVSSWSYCPISGHTDLSFEKILQQIAKTITQEGSNSASSLSAVFGHFENQNKKIILMLDDAGELVPGLITALIQYAAANPVLRLIFVLTHDDLYVKNTTDRAIEDCHFIEIPPLSEKQCGDFLQHLAAKPLAQISFASIDEALIAKIYRETHGIPGKIIAELPEISKPKKIANPTVILVVAVVVLVSLAFGLQWYSANRNIFEKKTAASVKPARMVANAKVKAVEPNPPITPPVETITLPTSPSSPVDKHPADQSGVAPNTEDSVKDPVDVKIISPADKNAQPLTASAETILPKTEIKPQQDKLMEAVPRSNSGAQESVSNKTEIIQQPQVNETNVSVASEEETADIALASTEEHDWIKNQPDESYTLQVMVLTKEQAVKDVINNFQGLEQPMNYIKKNSSKGREKFLLFYGSFSSAEAANKAKQSLPSELRKAYLRKFRDIKTEADTSR
jgi:DamX protein